MILKCIALLFAAVALAGCCFSGNGCYAPVAEAPAAWDGLDPAPTENVDEYKPKRNSRRNTAAARPDPGTESNDQWSQEQAADREADAKLRKQLRICSSC
jgi:hypothetical protein